MAATQNEGKQAPSNRQLALSWREDEIISVYKQTPIFKPHGNSVTGFVYPPNDPIAHVKFSYLPQAMAEVKNQAYAYNALKAMPPDKTKGILIPEIYRTFESGERLFIVMEYIPGMTLKEVQEQPNWESRRVAITSSIARAINLLMSIPVPPGQKPGPVDGGRIRHPLFKDDTSWGEYSSIDELEEHLNKVSTIRFKNSPTVRLERDLCFYYSDFYDGNFILADTGDLCVIDFDQAGFLPLSFMSFALAESRWDPGFWIKDILDLPENNLKAMKKKFYWFAIGVSWLGHSRFERRY